jgi:hypothetical protein
MTVKFSGASWLWLAGYVIAMTALIAALVVARERVVERLSRPEAQRQWQAWRDEVRRRNAAQSPNSRHAVASDEPPSLVLLRDRFPAIVATSVLVGSFLFAFLMFVARGVARQSVVSSPAADDLAP